MRKICVVTGTRAEYGLLRRLISLIKNCSDFDLQLIVAGMHLSKKFGETYREIEDDGFVINHKINLNLMADTPFDITDSVSLGLREFGKTFSLLEPDLIIILGDRFEVLSAAIAAMFAMIPIAHLHGGELTEGAIDDAIRHSITKMSHLHFVANKEYEKRVIQLGEDPKKVFNVGGLGVDAIKNIKLLNKNELENSLGFKFKKKNLLITFHPATLEVNGPQNDISELLDALSNLDDTELIFTMPNADAGNKIIFELIEHFVSNNSNAHVFTSLGQLRYLSCIKQVDAVIGNSSSGLTEVPTFRKTTINIGDRQKGRMMAESIINCRPISRDIQNAIKKSYTDKHRKILQKVKNPYGDGGASERIFTILRLVSFDSLLKKNFHDLG